MTDITELALITKIKNQLKNFDTVVLKEGEALALVEVLEKAQRAQPCEHSMFWDASGVKRCSKCDNAELESRTVTVKLPERYACELGYNAPDPNGDMLDRDDAIAVLTAAGIKWETE